METKFRDSKTYLDSNRDNRPWNNSWCRLLSSTRSQEKLRTVLLDCQDSLTRLYEACNSDEIMEMFWDLQNCIIFLKTACSACDSFLSMADEGRKRDAGQAHLCNGLNYFLKRVNDSKVILKALAKPCSNLDRRIYSGMLEAFLSLQSLSLYLDQEQKRKRSKKNRNKEIRQNDKPSTALEKESDESPSSEEGEEKIISPSKLKI